MCGSGVVRGQAMPADPPRACGHASWGSHASCQPIFLAPVVMRHGGFMCHASRSSSRLWSCVMVEQSGLAPVGRCPPSICHASRVMCHARRHFGCLSHARHASPRLLAYRHCDRWRLRRRVACHSVCWQKTGRVGESTTALERVGLIPHKGRCDLTLAVQVGAHFSIRSA